MAKRYGIEELGDDVYKYVAAHRVLKGETSAEEKKPVVPACKIHIDEVAGICDLLIYDGNTGNPINNIRAFVLERSGGDPPRLKLGIIHKITRTLPNKGDSAEVV